MPGSAAQDHLPNLLREQRRRAVERDGYEHGSGSWQRATDDLDELNAEIMHFASVGRMPLKSLGGGMSLDLESTPEEDVVFRQQVVRCFRRAMLDAVAKEQIEQSERHLPAGEKAMRASVPAVARARLFLRRAYPAASLRSTGVVDATISVRADRNGDVAEGLRPQAGPTA